MIKGNIKLPGDKSISHRAALFASLYKGKSRFSNFNNNQDCSATLNCLAALGIDYRFDSGGNLDIHGKDIKAWKEPANLNAQNSGTTARLLSGILANVTFPTQLTGDKSLSKRPMQRIIEPLKLMGANIKSNDFKLPLSFLPVNQLQGIEYELPVASAQVKSAVLLAGLFAEGQTAVIEEYQTRDHTERMLGLNTEFINGKKYIYSSRLQLIPDLNMEVPGDISSAAFFIAAALSVKQSDLIISSICLNPTRTGILQVLKDMGAQIEVNPKNKQVEPIGDLHIKYSSLTNLNVDKQLIPNIIDEIPILAVLATQADGLFTVRNARELRFKESDRIKTIVNNLKNLGIVVEDYDDGFELEGPQHIQSGEVITEGDHRIAMAFKVAEIISGKKIVIDNPKCAAVSFPDFYQILNLINH